MIKKALFLLFLSFNAFCQPDMILPEESFDFGTIEEGVQASHTFAVKNSGNQPLIISNVRPSCGCTTPDWTKSPIQPGGKGTIMATYNSQGRPGAFTKLITIETNIQGQSKSLTIKGFVGPKAEKVYTEEQKKNSPKVTFERTVYNFGKIEAGQTIRQKVKITNTGKSNLKVSGIQSGCHCIEYTLKKPDLLPGEFTEIEFLYKPTNQGEQNDLVTLSTNDITFKDQVVNFKANVVQGFGGGNILNTGVSPSPFK